MNKATKNGDNVKNAEMFEAISSDFANHAGDRFTLDTLEELLSIYPIDYDAYDLKAIRSAVGYPTNWGSFEYVFNWEGSGNDLAILFDRNELKTLYIVDAGELRNICEGDRYNETPIWRPCGKARIIGRFSSRERAMKVFNETDPMDEWFELVEDTQHAVYVEVYSEDYDANGNRYGCGRIDEKVFFISRPSRRHHATELTHA